MSNELRSLIGAVRRRWLTLLALRTAARALSAAAVPLIAGYALDRLIAPSGGALVLLALVTIAAAIGVAGAIVWRSLRWPDDREVARFIEERVARDPSIAPLDDALVSAVDSVSASEAPAFAPLVVAQSATRLRQIPRSAIVPVTAIRLGILQAAAALLVLALALDVARVSLSRAADTARLLFFPATIHVEVTPGDVRVVAGHPVRIRATIRGGEAALQRITPALTVWAGSDRRTVPMARSRDGFDFAFESVDRTFRYRVSAGAAVSDEFTVTALVAPRVKRIDVRYVYPPFTGLPARDEEAGGDLYAPAGTHVRLQVHTDKPVTAGDLAFARAAAATLRPAGDRVLEADLVLSSEDSYRVRLADADGLRSSGETEYFIRLVDDRPPEVRILRPSGDQRITPLEEVAIEARADDDYGISRFELVYSVAGRSERVVPFARVTGTNIEKIGAHLLPAEDLHVQPGDVITYYARARDVARGKQSTEAKSDIFFLEVKPFNEEFASAESQAMSGAAGTQIDSLIAAQKEIINATWNLERRSAAGRSAADLKAIADAQAELKRRAEQMADRGRPRRWPRQPQQIVSPGAARSPQAGDPVAAAVEAMGRALQHLEEQRTKEAIPNEMAALQGLLQAQAEVRRRQVTQQQAGGGGGSGRQGEDLSALFDKELQRQQRTNYETRSQVSESPESQSKDEALDRVRDLAKRQEDLSTRQRELASSGVSEEERKRQLEKLTREQAELRDEADRLARQMGQPQSQSQAQTPGQQSQQGQSTPQKGQQGGDPGQSQGESQGQSGSSEMRGASEQMRAATSDLRRQDPEAAARSGQRAADQLRRLEQQMNAGTTSAKQRAAGELQLEAQQIAEAQRRVAAEAERLGTAGGAAAAEARRRLAAEKDRLADRIDELRRSAEQLAKDQGKGPAAAGAADAAREIEQQRLGQQMRETARSLRGEAGAAGANPRQGQAAAEQQLARAMDRVVDKLGGESRADARRLAEQLDQTREVRERLNQLERQIRETEAKMQAAGRGGRAGQPGKGEQGRGADARLGEELQRLRQEYARELQRAQQAFAPNGQGEQRSGSGRSTPEQQEYSRSAPGTEAFKQDFSNWESLRKNVDLALEKYEAAASARLERKPGDNRLSAGGSERVPDAYRDILARYYESLAKVKK